MRQNMLESLGDKIFLGKKEKMWYKECCIIFMGR